MSTPVPKLEVNPKEALPSGAPVDKVVLRYSQPSHRAFFSSVMQRLQQPEVSPRQLLSALTDAVDEMERDDAKKAEEEARRLDEEKKRTEEAARKAEEEAKKAEADAKRVEEEAKKAAEELLRARKANEARKAEEARQLEEARKAEQARRVEEVRRAEEARQGDEARAAEAARNAEEEARKRRLLQYLEEEAKRVQEEAKNRSAMRACGVCLAPNPESRAVFATCGHVACLKCAEGAAARNTRLECPFCAAPTTYMRLFEREQVTKGAEASPKSPRGVRFSDTNEVKEFEKDDEDAPDGAQAVAVKKGNSLGCGMPWFGRKDN